MAWIVIKAFTNGAGLRFNVGDKITSEDAKEMNLASKPDLARDDRAKTGKE